MNEENLKQLSKLHKEIQDIENRIKRYEQMSQTVVTDSVKGSSHSFPYNEVSFKITGIDYKAANNLWKTQSVLIARQKQLNHEILQTEEFINQIADSEIRQIITIRYIENKSWNHVAKRVYGYPYGDRARMRLNRFFKKN